MVPVRPMRRDPPAELDEPNDAAGHHQNPEYPAGNACFGSRFNVGIVRWCAPNARVFDMRLRFVGDLALGFSEVIDANPKDRVLRHVAEPAKRYLPPSIHGIPVVVRLGILDGFHCSQ